MSGRVGSLIEVRAGIHPELSGRENIHLYGTLLGLPRKQVAERFDEIVDFAEIDDAIDRQVKFYSSGMQMRLGFGVAAFLEPEVLLVDEVLAVGDATFQQRCLDRMRVVLAQGTTLVFVSHDLATVEGVCDRAVWLRDGVVAGDGPVRDVLNSYREALEQVAELGARSGSIELRAATVRSPDGSGPRTQEPCDVHVRFHNIDRSGGTITIGVSEGPAAPVFLLSHGLSLPPDAEVDVRCHIEHLPLPRGRYYLWVGILTRQGDPMGWQPVAHFDVIGPDLDESPAGIVRLAPVHVAARWDVSELT